MTYRCIHIADVHWRGLTRHSEYKKAFSNLFEQARLLNPDSFVIAGDIVHSKTQGISPELIDCLNWWFTEMSRIAPVHVMLGNHDGLILNSDRQDAISPILRALNLSRVHLYRDSGTYEDPYNPDIEWCVFSPFDEPGYNNIVANPDKISIALYHGAVWGSHTDTNFMLDGDCRMDLFKTFDFTMLGDIHKRQQIDADGRIWYPGSTIQQNYGESGEKGFLLWEIESKDKWTVDFHPVLHDKPFVTVGWEENIQSTVKECQKWPKGARYRIKSSYQLDPKTQRKLSTVLRREWKADEVVYKLDIKKGANYESTEDNTVKIENLNSSETHKKLLRDYVNENNDYTDEFWKEVDRIVDLMIPKVSSISDLNSNKWSLKKLNFSNTFGYGSDNEIDFEKLSGIIGLFGKNRCGKSSIPGTLMYALYNSNDRGISGITHVINSRAQHCDADLTFSVNGKLYRLERQSVRYKSRGGRGGGAMTYLNLYEVSDDGSIIKDMSGEQRKDTEKELRSLIGTSDEFLLTSFAAQGNMNNFISHGSTERKRIISNFLGLDIFDSFQSLLKEDSADIKGALKRIDAKDWVAEIREQRSDIKELSIRKNEAQSSIDELGNRLEELKAQARNESTDFVDPSILENKESILANKEATKKRLNSSLNNFIEKIADTQARLQRYEAIKSKIPIDLLRRRFDMLENLEKSLKDLQHQKALEKQRLTSKKKLAKKLEPCDCFEHLPSCQYVRQSDENKKVILEQKQKLDDATSALGEMSKQVLELQGQDLNIKIQKYRAMLQKENDDTVSLLMLESKKETTENKIERLNDDMSSLNSEIHDLRVRINADENETIRLIQARIDATNGKISNLRAELVSNAKKTGQKQMRIEFLENEQLEYDRLQVEWKVYDFLLKATSWRGIPTFIMGTQIPLINSELSAILQETTGFTVELEMDEKNTDIYLNYGDSRRPIECGSGMEKMVSSMALRVALSNISNLNKSDMFIVDEGFGSLDAQNIEAVTSLLHGLKRYYKMILVISHVEVVKDSVDGSLEISKNGKNSKVVYA